MKDGMLDAIDDGAIRLDAGMLLEESCSSAIRMLWFFVHARGRVFEKVPYRCVGLTRHGTRYKQHCIGMEEAEQKCTSVCLASQAASYERIRVIVHYLYPSSGSARPPVNPRDTLLPEVHVQRMVMTRTAANSVQPT